MRAPVSAEVDQVQGLHALAGLRREVVLEQHEAGPVPASRTQAVEQARALGLLALFLSQAPIGGSGV